VTRLALLALLAAAPAVRAAAPASAPPDTTRARALADDALADSMRVDAVLAWVRQEDEARRQARPSGLRARVAALRRQIAAPALLAVPPGAEALVDRQTAVVSGRFADTVGRGRWMLPMIEQALRGRGLPDELKYVAVIESALNPSATSPVGAAGLWQFMPDTAAEFGLDAWSVRDPMRSTDAAVRFLDTLGRQFNGDWQLALAAYNCGPGRVGRLVAAHRARTGETPTFWDLRPSLPAETRDYVVRFIAAAQYFETHRDVEI
jgi:membrane-bound lytic murein transglycosylase D